MSVPDHKIFGGLKSQKMANYKLGKPGVVPNVGLILKVTEESISLKNQAGCINKNLNSET